MPSNQGTPSVLRSPPPVLPLACCTESPPPLTQPFPAGGSYISVSPSGSLLLQHHHHNRYQHQPVPMLEEPLRLPPHSTTPTSDLPRRSCRSSGFPSNQGTPTDQMTSVRVGGGVGNICEECPSRTTPVGLEVGTCCSGSDSSAEGSWSTDTSISKTRNGRRTIVPREDPDILDPTRRMRRRELTQFNPEEAERIVRRRERNKVAATKCRVKRRAQHEELVKELQSMECNNTTLTYEIRQLQRQRQALSDVLRHHQMSCSVNHLLSARENSPQQMEPTQMTNSSAIPGPYPLPYPR